MSTQIGSLTLGHGVNLQPSYYNNGHVNFAWALMKQQTAIKTVRIEIEPDKVTQAIDWINQAKANGYQVIATYHKSAVLGTDSVPELLAAANWWKANYHSFGLNVIINLMNEWGSHNITAAAYANAYNQAITIVRTAYAGPIIIDAPGWGQDTHTIWQAIQGTNPLIHDHNIIASVHIYQGSWNSHTGQFLAPHDLDELALSGKPCIVGEFGPAGTGTCDWQACVTRSISKGWSAIGWCWNGDGNGFNMVSPAWSANPTATVFTKSSQFNTIYNHLTTTV